MFYDQSYPQYLLEWIIVDDGTDPIKDLVSHIPNVKYFYYENKMTLGKKRNLMHEKATGDIIVYMDDDDYYPKRELVMQSAPIETSTLCAGSSEIFIYFKHISQMIKFGPYGTTTAGTFAFKKNF